MKFSRKVLITLTAYVQLHTLILCQVMQIEDGLIEGRVMQSRSGVSFSAFLGIPFAEPPLNELRFQAPIPKRPWDGVLNCTIFGPICFPTGGDDFASEDCLQLNVFTKNLPHNGTTEPKPVIAYIHGGGFQTGTARNHGPEYLMDRDIVLVTIQYRLGAFGFMAVETSEVSGNQALKDQSLGLRWIQANIRHFGGDSGRVTLTGFSAGSFSATAHMISPMSQGLFHSLIGVSGSIADQNKLMTNNIDNVMEVALRINCSIETIDSMLNCLRNTSAQVIAQNMEITTFPCTIGRLPWAPVIEPDLGQPRFITDDPTTLFREGNFSRVNVIMGLTTHEFIWPVVDILYDKNATDFLNENWDKIAPICFNFEGNEYRSAEEMGKILRESYIPFDTIDIRSFNNLNNLVADGIIRYGVHKFVHLINTFVDVFYYKFSYIGQSSLFNFPRNHPYGAHHGDDVQYVFNFGLHEIEFPLEHVDSFFVERMTRIWEQFAWAHNPNNQKLEYLEQMLWPEHNNAFEWYLDIGNHLVEKNGLYLERFTVWDSFETNSTLDTGN